MTYHFISYFIIYGLHMSIVANSHRKFCTVLSRHQQAAEGPSIDHSGIQNHFDGRTTLHVVAGLLPLDL